MIEWNKETNSAKCSNGAASDYIREMESAVDDFCERLSKDSKDFSPEVFFDKLHAYIIKDERLLYTNITNYIFSLEKEEIFGIMQTNLDKVINYMFSERFNEEHSWKPDHEHTENPFERTKRTVLKIWDHMNLAKRQYEFFTIKDEGYAAIVDEKMADAELRLSKEMNGQLISLVSIFTALSFLIFGGISSLDNIFIGAKDIPVTKLMIVGLIWCFCILNLVFVFMFFIAKMIKLNIKSSQDINANLVQRYPLIWWCNFVLMSLLALSCWAYYVKSERLSLEAYYYLSQQSSLYFITGTIVIIGLILGSAIKIYHLSKAE